MRAEYKKKEGNSAPKFRVGETKTYQEHLPAISWTWLIVNNPKTGQAKNSNSTGRGIKVESN